MSPIKPGCPCGQMKGRWRWRHLPSSHVGQPDVAAHLCIGGCLEWTQAQGRCRPRGLAGPRLRAGAGSPRHMRLFPSCPHAERVTNVGEEQQHLAEFETTGTCGA